MGNKYRTRRRRRRRKGGLGLWRKSSRIRPGTAAQANPPPPPMIVGIALYHWEHNPETREELINQYPEIAREVQRLAHRRAQRRRCYSSRGESDQGCSWYAGTVVSVVMLDSVFIG